MSNFLYSKRVSQTIKVLTRCSHIDAEVAAKKVCQSNSALNLLGVACTGSTALTIVLKSTLPNTIWTGVNLVTLVHLGLTAASTAAATNFCMALVKHKSRNLAELEREFEHELKKRGSN